MDGSGSACELDDEVSRACTSDDSENRDPVLFFFFGVSGTLEAGVEVPDPCFEDEPDARDPFALEEPVTLGSDAAAVIKSSSGDAERSCLGSFRSAVPRISDD